MNPYLRWTTPEILAFLGLQYERLQQQLQVFRVRALGAEPQLSLYERGKAQVTKYTSDILEGVGWVTDETIKLTAKPLTVPSAMLREELDAYGQLLGKWTKDTFRAGYTEIGFAIAELSSRLGKAAMEVGKGTGSAFRSFWGAAPVAILGGGLLFALAGAYTLTTPGALQLAQIVSTTAVKLQ